MDENKRKKLREIGYSIKPCCALCKHGSFTRTVTWGTCDLHEYTHLKHTGPDRKLSIHRLGHCKHFELHGRRTSTLGQYGVYVTVIS
jgi:hypothetical protein